MAGKRKSSKRVESSSETQSHSEETGGGVAVLERPESTEESHVLPVVPAAEAAHAAALEKISAENPLPQAVPGMVQSPMMDTAEEARSFLNNMEKQKGAYADRLLHDYREGSKLIDRISRTLLDLGKEVPQIKLSTMTITPLSHTAENQQEIPRRMGRPKGSRNVTETAPSEEKVDGRKRRTSSGPRDGSKASLVLLTVQRHATSKKSALGAGEILKLAHKLGYKNLTQQDVSTNLQAMRAPRSPLPKIEAIQGKNRRDMTYFALPI
jgi:hypothetical protein